MLEFIDTPALRTSGITAGVVFEELDASAALPVFEVLHALFLYAGRERESPWFSPERVREWEEELLLSGLDPELRNVLGVLVGHLADPARLDLPALSRACLVGAEWALWRSAERTATVFFEAGALLRPDNARFAYMAGRAFKTKEMSREAEQWLVRASKLARWGRDWSTYVLAENSLGMLHWDHGAGSRARLHLERARRESRKHGLRAVEAIALHNLFVIHVTAGELDGVEEYARKALARYLPNHSRIPALAYDIAYYWLTRGYAGRALPIFRKLVHHFPEPRQRIQVLAAIARAAGACGDGETFEDAWTDSRAVLGAPGACRTWAAALVDLGLGAAHMEQWERARGCFEEAAAHAERLGQSDVLIRADACLEAVRERRNPDTIQRPARVLAARGPDEEFAGECLQALRIYTETAQCPAEAESLI